MIATLALGIVVFAATVALDFAHARYVQAVARRVPHLAARWSVAQWCAATIGFVLAVRVSMWLLPFEACGLYVGTLLATRQVDDEDEPASDE